MNTTVDKKPYVRYEPYVKSVVESASIDSIIIRDDSNDVHQNYQNDDIANPVVVNERKQSLPESDQFFILGVNAFSLDDQ